VRRICQLLADHPVTGLDIGCGTGRYTRLLRTLLPDGSRLAASDVSAAMLAQLQAASNGHARAVAPLLQRLNSGGLCLLDHLRRACVMAPGGGSTPGL
jgi:trans-aconitate methyltransferase